MLELSKRITGEEELTVLGINVLKVPDFVIKTALYNKKEIQLATHEILSTWLKQQCSRQEAFINLHTGLKKFEMNQLAAVIKELVERTTAGKSQTPEKGECACVKCPITNYRLGWCLQLF